MEGAGVGGVEAGRVEGQALLHYRVKDWSGILRPHYQKDRTFTFKYCVKNHKRSPWKHRNYRDVQRVYMDSSAITTCLSVCLSVCVYVFCNTDN